MRLLAVIVLAVIVFEISLLEVFDVQICKGHQLKNAKGDNKKQTFVFKFSPDNLILTLYQLSKFEAPSCNGFLRYQVFYDIITKGQ